MKVYILSDKNGIPWGYNCANAYQGFKEMGFEIVLFKSLDELSAANKEDLVVGGISLIQNHLSRFDIKCPNIDYPDSLSMFIRRKITREKLSVIANTPEKWPVFIKPVEDKLFVGTTIRNPGDLVGCGEQGRDRDVYCSEVVDFVAEWRCFVRYGQILDVRQYSGSWKKNLNADIVEAAVHSYTDAPAGYALDFGLTSERNTIVVEVNDGYALGCYGLNSISYAKLLSARWAELTNTYDECNFDQIFRK